MPTDMFGDLWPLVRDLAAGAGAPAEYVAVSVIAVAASLIGAKRSVQPFATSPQWREPCVLWIAPVGDPSSNKSPAIDAATSPLKGMEKELAEQHKQGLIGWHTNAERAKAERSEWQAKVKTATKEGIATPSMPDAAVEPDEPQRPRLMVQDGTPEAVMDILSGNPIRYERPRSVANVSILERVYRRLLALQPARDEEGEASPVVLMLSDKAGVIFEEWIRDNNAVIGEAAGLYKGFLGKLRGMVLRLALVAELIAWAAGDGPEPAAIRPETLVSVLGFIEDYAKPSALRVFGDAALPLSERNAAALGKHILKTKTQRINLRDVRRSSGIATLKIAADVEAAAEALVEAGWLRDAKQRLGDTPGRPSKDYLVNPAVHGGAHG